MSGPEELEFIAERELIGIVPNINLDETYLVEGQMDRFRAGLPTQVPLWIAMHLRRMERCSIIPPEWMTVHYLEQVKHTERESQLFTRMPSEYYMEFSKILLLNCPQDIPDATEIKTLIKDIWDNRVAKLRTAVLMFIEKGATFAKVDNLTRMEMATVRPFFPHALEHLHRIRSETHKVITNSQANTSRNSNSMSMSMSMSNSQPGPSSNRQY